jgi:multidrug efflux system membrane fusion protein
MNPQDANVPPSPAHSTARAAPPAPPRRTSRWVGTTIALVLVALVGAAAWYLIQRANPPSAGGGGRGFAGAGRPMVTVGDAVARKADLPVVLEALGTVTPATAVTLRPQVSGLLTKVLFTEGQLVKKGQLLAQIDPRPFEQALMQAQGTRQRDEAQLENARLTLQRYRTLLQQDSIARQDVDTQAALVKQLEGTVMTDKAQEGTARLNLEHTRITAPVAGRIGLRTVDVGNYVSTGDASGVATITQVAPIDVQFAVPQDRLTDIRLAQGESQVLAVVALDRARKVELGAGQFSTLDNQVDTATGTVKAKARFENGAGTLFPSQFVNVRLLLRNVPSVVVPVTAVRTGANGDYVYVIRDDNTVALRKVQRGQATVSVVAITEGLSEGERVVTEGGDRLQDGMAVQRPGVTGAPGATGATGAGGARGPRGAASGPRTGASGPRGAGGPDGQRRPRPPQNP